MNLDRRTVRHAAWTALVSVLIAATSPLSSNASEIIVFGDAGHSFTGSWSNNGTGYNEKYQTTTDNGATSTHEFTGLDNGTYYVWVNWTEFSNRTSVATYVITDGGGTNYENQKLANSDVWADGDFWTLLDVVGVGDGDLSITASDMDLPTQPGEMLFLMSDAIRISTHEYHETVGGGLAIDNYYGVGFSTTGTWNSPSGEGYLDSYSFQSTADGSETATYSFTGLPNGTYNVSATWVELFNRSNDAVYSISDGGGDVHVNQQAAPGGVIDETEWQVLSTGVEVTDGTLEIVLSDNDAVGFLIADAIRISTDLTDVYYQTQAGALVIDNGDSTIGFSYTGDFTNQLTGYLGDEWFQTDPAGDASDTATFSFINLDNGAYSVSAVWSPLFNRTTDAVFTISDDGGAVSVDQTLAPSGGMDEVIWETLHSGVVVSDGTLDVVLTDNDAEGYLMVDAVRIRDISTATSRAWHDATAPGPLDSDWADAINWEAGATPDFIDSAQIDHTTGTDFPVISSAVGQVADVLLASGADTIGNLMVATGGSVQVNGTLEIASGANSFGKLTIAGGDVAAATLDMAADATATAFVNVDKGTLQCGTLTFGSGEASIDIEPSGALLLNGDQTTAVTAWVSGGQITGGNGVGIVTWDYDETHAGFTTVVAGGTPAGIVFYTAHFEPTEVNPGRWPDSGVINTTPYPTPSEPYPPAPFSTTGSPEPDGDNFGWQNRASNYTTGDTSLIYSQPYTGGGSVEVINRTLRSDIEHTLLANTVYSFTFWYYVPSGAGMTQTFFNKVVVKDQTNDHLFLNTDNSDYTTAPAFDTWFRRTVAFDTTGYAHAGELIDLRFGIWASGAEGDGVITDNWSVSHVVEDSFNEVTAMVGLDRTYTPTGNDNNVAWGDYNNDGFVDLYVSYDAEASMFENTGAGSFTEIVGVGPGGGGGALWVDYDNDGFSDLYTTQAGAHASHNNGNGTFTHANGGYGGNAVATQSECAAWGDFDNDGDLDFYRVGWQKDQLAYPEDAIFLKNDSAMLFDLDWQGPTGDDQEGRGAAACDFDEDGDIDIYVSNYYIQFGDFSNYLWLNDGTGSFTDVALTYGAKGDGRTIGSAWGDLDNDGHFDLVVGNFDHHDGYGEETRFLRNMGAGGSWHFEDKSATVNLPWVESYATPALADYDNDGDLDIFITAVSGYYFGQTSTLMRNDGNWSFTDVSDDYGLRLATPNTNFQAAWADYDNDGDLDLFTGRKLYRNDVDQTNHWLMVDLQGDGTTVNAGAVGAQARIDLGDGVILTRQVEAGMGWGNQNDPRLHFGLGSETGPVDLEIIWPDGAVEIISDVAVDQVVSYASDQCFTCAGDINDDAWVKPDDIPGFVDVLLGYSSNSCADMNGDGADGGDIQAFVDRIIEGGAAGYDCP